MAFQESFFISTMTAFLASKFGFKVMADVSCKSCGCLKALWHDPAKHLNKCCFKCALLWLNTPLKNGNDLLHCMHLYRFAL